MLVPVSKSTFQIFLARRCLDEIVIEGPRTNIPFVRRIIDHPAFVAGDFDTGFVGRMLAERAAEQAKAN